MQAEPEPPAARASRVATWCLVACVVGTLVDLCLGNPPIAVAAVSCLAVFLVIAWQRLFANARVLLMACVALAGLVVWRADGMLLLAAARRTTFLPSFLAMLSLLRAAASFSPAIAAAGRHLVNQPPPRRYAALTVGGNVFGALLNIGGLALLLDMTKQANTLAAAGGDRTVVAWRERRMTLAVLRGFAAIPLWSPLGIALNLLLAVIPGASWIAIAPAGLLVTAAFLTLGWLFDRLTAPRGRRVATRTPEPGGAAAIAIVVAHIAALSALTLGAELALRASFQAVLMFVVPAYALVWLVRLSRREGAARPLRTSLARLQARGVSRFPALANEIAIFAASGFLGLVLAAVMPREPVQQLLAAIPASPNLVAAGLSAVVFGLSLAGISPIVSVSILGGTVAAVGVPGLTPSMLTLALAGTWTCAVAFSPLMSSLALAANLIGRPAREVGFVWNGPFSLTAFALWLVFLLLVPV